MPWTPNKIGRKKNIHRIEYRRNQINLTKIEEQQQKTKYFFTRLLGMIEQRRKDLAILGIIKTT